MPILGDFVELKMLTKMSSIEKGLWIKILEFSKDKLQSVCVGGGGMHLVIHRHL